MGGDIFQHWPSEQLAGNIDQTYGGVTVLMDGGASFNLRDHTENWQLMGLDSETEGCNPKIQTPCHNANIVCWSFAYFPTKIEYGLRGQPLSKRVFVYGKPAGHMRTNVTDPSIGKVLSSSHYDLHAFMNAGVDVSAGLALDTVRLSRLLNPHQKEHGLKLLMMRLLEYALGDYKELFSRRMKSEKTGKLLKKTELIPLSLIDINHPLFPTLVDYASLDPKGTLEAAIMLVRGIVQRTTYSLPRWLDEFETKPGWATLLQQLIKSA